VYTSEGLEMNILPCNCKV